MSEGMFCINNNDEAREAATSPAPKQKQTE